ncbi:hypothetical protein GRF29_8g2767418 [Pseudopithomyces chartarum]|uniref:SHSP domain-containing protein n=1 Tax=Pseudopithomyces chartarum TaxID=1892770 RepID=A0AAN6RKY8_9PLEO|nr:hypothetical protein GRF29_8g2767418 [Pseudopithomyces chartarum]
MAFFLTPRFAPAYTAPQCNPWACAPRPQHSYRRVLRPAFSSLSSFAPFTNEVDELVSALEQEARREAHRQRQQRKRLVRAQFNVHENEGGYQIDAELPYFNQEHFEIEVTDDNTLKLSGNTERKSKHQQPQPAEVASPEQSAEVQTPESDAQQPAMDGVTLNEPEDVSAGVSTPAGSDTDSHKSYQPTVEDDFEDLGAETASTYSAHSETAEPKGKEKAVEEPSAVVPAPDAAIQQQQQQQEQQPSAEEEQWEFQGSFERTFRFPERIDAANVSASFKNGLLSVTVPKAKVPEVRRILIQ